MRALIFGLVLLVSSQLAYAGAPTEAVETAVDKILTIASQQELSTEERNKRLLVVMNEHVDLQAVAQRVLAVHWRKATREEKIEFIRLFREVLTRTYSSLLDEYENEKVTFTKEEIKKDVYAEVDSIVLSQGKEIPVSYRLLYRDDTWRLYDLIPEGISMVRSFGTEYQSILRTEGVSGLNAKLKEKIEKSSSTD